jgi:hypothetical protein
MGAGPKPQAWTGQVPKRVRGSLFSNLSLRGAASCPKGQGILVLGGGASWSLLEEKVSKPNF